jgi:hypothetical protein
MMRHLSQCFLMLLLAAPQTSVPLGRDLHGNEIRSLQLPDTRVVVLVFAASDCPISNRYVPEIARLDRLFSGQGVAFWWVFPNPGDTSSVVTQHNRAFSIPEGTVLDRQQTLVRMAHATRTPEASVFVVTKGGLREVYLGRIDDRYLSIGRERPKPQHHDLETAISSALTGNTAHQPSEPSVGCSIEFFRP